MSVMCAYYQVRIIGNLGNIGTIQAKSFLRSGLGMQEQNWRVPACPVSRQNAS